VQDATSDVAQLLRNQVRNVDKGAHQISSSSASPIEMKAIDLILKRLQESGVIYAAISEKASKDKIVLNPEGRYTVTFDPLDNGGSNLDCNFAVGTIFGLWDSKDVVGSKVTGRSKLVGAAICGYGTRTTMMVYNPLYKHIEELTLMA